MDTGPKTSMQLTRTMVVLPILRVSLPPLIQRYDKKAFAISLRSYTHR